MPIFNDLSQLQKQVPKEYFDLKRSGKALLLEIKEDIERDLDTWPDNNPLSVLMAKALVWAGYANEGDSGFDYLINFIDAKEKVDNQEFIDASERMGAEKLKQSTQSYRRFLNLIKSEGFELDNVNTKNLLSTNRSWLSWVERTKKEGKISGFGAWLFSVLFYEIICLREELWDRQELESVLMPFGLEVNRGLRQAKKVGLPAFQNMDSNQLLKYDKGPYESDLNENYSTLMEAQSYISEVAKLVETGVIVINAGLYNLGRGKLKFT